MYKLILTDLDGTLLKDDNTLTNKNHSLIHKAVAGGCPVVVCSGRSNMSLDEIIKRYDLPKTYTIGFNGGIIYNKDQIIYEAFLTKELVCEIIDIAKDFNCEPLMYQMSKLWIEKETPNTRNYAQRSYLTPVLVSSLKDNVTDNVSKIIFIGDNSTLKKMEQKLSEAMGNKVSIVFSSQTLLEFNPPGVNKGVALKRLATHLNIDISQTIAIGDSYNDLEMLEAAGLGVAMANSNTDIKSKANYITENDNNNSGVGEVIEKFIMEE